MEDSDLEVVAPATGGDVRGRPSCTLVSGFERQRGGLAGTGTCLRRQATFRRLDTWLAGDTVTPACLARS